MKVADHGPVAVALADGDLVDADRLGTRRAGARDLGTHVLHLQRLDRVPVELQLLGNVADRGLRATPSDMEGKALGVARIVRQKIQPFAFHAAAMPACDTPHLQLQDDPVSRVIAVIEALGGQSVDDGDQRRVRVLPKRNAQAQGAVSAEVANKKVGQSLLAAGLIVAGASSRAGRTVIDPLTVPSDRSFTVGGCRFGGLLVLDPHAAIVVERHEHAVARDVIGIIGLLPLGQSLDLGFKLTELSVHDIGEFFGALVLRRQRVELGPHRVKPLLGPRAIAEPDADRRAACHGHAGSQCGLAPISSLRCEPHSRWFPAFR